MTFTALHCTCSGHSVHKQQWHSLCSYLYISTLLIMTCIYWLRLVLWTVCTDFMFWHDPCWNYWNEVVCMHMAPTFWMPLSRLHLSAECIVFCNGQYSPVARCFLLMTGCSHNSGEFNDAKCERNTDVYCIVHKIILSFTQHLVSKGF